MKASKFAAGSLVVAASLVTSCINVTVASADTSGCVTHSEFRHVHKGMSKHKVARTFDTSGKQTAITTGGGYTFEIRDYNTCSAYSVVSIAFENGLLSEKTAVWL